jgi:hypothetical protein
MGALEASCVHLLAAILRTTESVADAILMTPQSTRARLDIIRSVSRKMLSTDDSSEVISIVNKCDIALTKRNLIVHSVWGSDGKYVTVIPIPNGAPRTLTVDELRRQITSLRRLADEINILTYALLNRPNYNIHFTYNICIPIN